MLRRLLSAHGANASMVTVFIDGFFQGPVDVAGLFGIRAVQVRGQSFVSIIHTAIDKSWRDMARF